MGLWKSQVFLGGNLMKKKTARVHQGIKEKIHFNPRTRVGYDRALLPRLWPHWFSRSSKYPTGYQT